MDICLHFHLTAIGEDSSDGLLILAIQAIVRERTGEGGTGQLPLEGASGVGSEVERAAGEAGVGVALRMKVELGLLQQEWGIVRGCGGSHFGAHLGGTDLGADLAAGGRGHGGGGGREQPRPGARRRMRVSRAGLGTAAATAIFCYIELHHHGAEAVGATVRLRQRAQLLSGRQRVRHLPYGFHRLARVQDFEQTSAAQDEELISGGQRECGDVRARQDCRVEERIAHDACGVSYTVHFVVLLEKGNLP